MADTRSAEELVRRVTENPQLADEVRMDPATTLQRVAHQVVRDIPSLDRGHGLQVCGDIGDTFQDIRTPLGAF